MSTTYKRDDLLQFLRNVEAMVAAILRKQTVLSNNKGLSTPEQDSLRKQIVDEKQKLADFLARLSAPFLLALSDVASAAQWNMLFEWMPPPVALGLLGRLSREDRDRLRQRFTSRIWGKVKDAYTSHGRSVRNTFGQSLPEDYAIDLNDLEGYRKNLAAVLQILADDVAQNKPPETLRWVTYACLAWAQKYDGLGSSLVERCKRQDMRIAGAQAACQQVNKLYNPNMFRSAMARVQQLIPNALETLKPEWKAELSSLAHQRPGIVVELPREGAMEAVPGLSATIENQNVFKLF